MRGRMYKVNVVGRIWQGCEASYTYSFDTLPDANAISRKAGDFEYVRDYQIVLISSSTTRKGNEMTQVRKWKIVREWARPESADQFCDA